MGRKAAPAGTRLWKLIESIQGDSYLSDEMEEWGEDRDEEVMRRAINSMLAHQECAKKLKGFLRRNGIR